MRTRDIRAGPDGYRRALRRRRDHTLFLAYRRRGDRSARMTLIERFLPLAERLARRYQRRGETREDLVQVARVGLIKAVDGYQPDRGSAFSTYAVPTILGELKRHLRDHTWAVHVPRARQEQALMTRAATKKLEVRLGRAPTTRELAEEIDLSIEDTLEARQAEAALNAESLDVPITADDGEGDSRLELQGRTESGYARVENTATVEQCLALLDVRTREVLRLRFQGDLTQKEIGERIGCSQMHVSRLIRRGLEQLNALAAERRV